MNAKKVYESFIKSWEHLGFELEEDSNEERAEFTTDMIAKDYFTDHVHVRAVVFAEGTVHVFFIFDKIKRTEKVYELIDELNNSTSWAKGYISKINGNEFFEVHYAYYDASDEEYMVRHLNHAMSDLLSEGVLQKVSAVCKYTY